MVKISNLENIITNCLKFLILIMNLFYKKKYSLNNKIILKKKDF